MLHTAAGDRVDAARLARNTAVHQLSLRFEPGRLRVDRQDPPWKVVRAFGPLVHLHNVSGGVLAGDRLALDIEVAADARAQITTTGATRLYRHRVGREESSQQVRIHAGENSIVEYLPDPLIPFAGSRHSQRASIVLDRGAALFWWEILASGREAMGERFAFDRLRMSSAIDICGTPVLREDFLLEPERRTVASLARMGEFTHLISFYACKEGQPAVFWLELENHLREIAPETWGVSTLAGGGVVMRGLSSTSRGLLSTLTEIWSAAKLFVTGEIAIPPRKVQ